MLPTEAEGLNISERVIYSTAAETDSEHKSQGINSFHWPPLYLWVTIRDEASAAIMIELQRGGAWWGRMGVTNTSSCLP